MENREIISLKALSYSNILNEISLTLSTNEIYGIVGESGCGKTTLLKAVVGLIKASHGSVNYLGQEISSLSKTDLHKFRKNVQLVYQDAGGSLNPHLSIQEILIEPLAVHQEKENHETQIKKILEDFALPQKILKKNPAQLSGGEKQRVAIARSLILKPKLLLLDEAVTALDSNNQRITLDLIKKFQNEYKTTILFISHDLNSIGYLCDKIFVMKNGKIIESQNKIDFFKHPTQEYTKSLIASML